MTGTRLRPAPTGDELAAMYASPHDHRAYGAGHDLRVRVSVAIGLWLADDCGASAVADLTAGAGFIARALCPSPVLGDLAPGLPICGPIEATLPDLDPVDIYVCTETLEHLDDPESVLDLIRERARRLLVSFPHCDGPDINTEHLWQWTEAEAEGLLVAAGWRPLTSLVLEVPDGPYRYSIWGCA